MCSFRDPNLVTLYLCMYLMVNKEHFTFHLQYTHSGTFANYKYEELSYQKNQRTCDVILVTLLKMRSHDSHSSRENATPSSGTSPVVSYKELPPPPPGVNICNRVLVHRVNKLRATDSTISPGLTNKVHSIYISVPWFRFTLIDLSFRVLFHRLQIIFDRIRLTFSVAIGTKSTNAIKYSPGITAVLGDRARKRIK